MRRPLRILLAHSFYRSTEPSGENEIVHDLHRLLATRADADVLLYGPSNDQFRSRKKLSTGHAVLQLMWDLTNDLTEAIERFRPHVIQAHNWIPTVPASALRRAQSQGIAVCQVLHNYRFGCISGNYFRKGGPCSACNKGLMGRFNGIWHRCYQSSTAASTLVTAENMVHHWRWRELDGYIAISDYIATQARSIGIPTERLVHIPHGTDARPAIRIDARDLLFAGRLSSEKGVGLLLDAWASMPTELRREHNLHIAGTGELEGTVRAFAARDASVIYHGNLSKDELNRVGSECAITVLPSVWDEPFGLTAIEALASGRRVIVTDRGGLPEIVVRPSLGTVCKASPTALTAAIRQELRVAAGPSRDAIDEWRHRYSLEKMADSHLGFFRTLIRE